MVIPEVLQTPELMDALYRAAQAQGTPFEQLRVGSRAKSINPIAGAAEFAGGAPQRYDSDGPIGGVTVTAPSFREAPYFPGSRSDYGRVGGLGDRGA